MIGLGVNIDHVATIRQARRAREPDPVWAAVEAQLGGADAITVHLREDRRHIQDHDLERLGGVVQVRLNLEMAATDAMISIAAAAPNNRTPANNVYDLHTTPIDRNVARVNRAFFFRRALKLVNGGRGDLPNNRSQGLTVASENPVYVQGNYNACITSTTLPSMANGFNPACNGGVGFGNQPGVDHVSAAVIADYHLDDSTGPEAIGLVRAGLGAAVPAAIITADRMPEVQREVAALSLPLLNKPVRPAQLRALLLHLLERAAV